MFNFKSACGISKDVPNEEVREEKVQEVPRLTIAEVKFLQEMEKEIKQKMEGMFYIVHILKIVYWQFCLTSVKWHLFNITYWIPKGFHFVQGLVKSCKVLEFCSGWNNKLHYFTDCERRQGSAAESASFNARQKQNADFGVAMVSDICVVLATKLHLFIISIIAGKS